MNVEVKNYTYETMPDYTEPVEGAGEIIMQGDEKGVYYIPNVVYDTPDGIPLTLQIVKPGHLFRAGPALAVYCVCAGIGLDGAERVYQRRKPGGGWPKKGLCAPLCRHVTAARPRSRLRWWTPKTPCGF